MADHALVDAHVLVEPRISVSEGHYIAESARQRVLRNHHVMDVMVHIDPEDDSRSKPNVHLPDRTKLLALLVEQLASPLPLESRVVLHYLDGKIDVELFLSEQQTHKSPLEQLKLSSEELIRNDHRFRSIQFHCERAQQ
jgi:hypothetical protein